MPRIARTEILSRLRTKIARGQPIVGGGAGTGLSAKCEEAGGIDLIVIYNSGRYRMAGPVRFLIPEGGVSAIDRPGQPFHDPEADRALFAAIEQDFRSGSNRKLQRLPLHINDEAFADALVAAWQEISVSSTHARRA